MNGYFKKTAIAALCGAALGMSGCGSDSATTSSITVTPSLGQISNATVTIYQGDGSTVLGSGEIGADGAVAIGFSGYSGAVVIEVAGDDDAQYFDEASGMLVNFPAGQKLRAIAPTASGSFAVSILTELAYQGAVSENLLPLDATEVNALNEKVRAALIPEIADLLTPPALFNAGTTSGALANADAGEYALKLAALAKLGNGEAAPALAVMQALAADLADGDIDGLDAGGNSVNAPYSNFASEFGAAITAMAADYGSSDLQAAAGGFAAPALTIDFGTVSSGGGNGNGAGSALSCDTSLFASGTALHAPSTTEWAAYAKTYPVDEGTFNSEPPPAPSFIKTGSGSLVLETTYGAVTYNGTAYPLATACVVGGAYPMLYLGFASGSHIDLFDDGTVSGLSPANVMVGITSGAGGENGGSGGGTGVTLSSAIGGTSEIANATATFSPYGNALKGVWGDSMSGVQLVVAHSSQSSAENPNISSGTTEFLQLALAKVSPLTSAQLDVQGGLCVLSGNYPDSVARCAARGITFDKTGGLVSFSATPMKDMIGSAGQFTISGSMSFTPF